ncbi:MAG: hypothetical protein R3E39_14015 [Anaerolineae bacterium]
MTKIKLLFLFAALLAFSIIGWLPGLEPVLAQIPKVVSVPASNTEVPGLDGVGDEALGPVRQSMKSRPVVALTKAQN